MRRPFFLIALLVKKVDFYLGIIFKRTFFAKSIVLIY